MKIQVHDSLLKESAPFPSPLPRSVVPLEFTACIVKIGLFFFSVQRRLLVVIVVFFAGAPVSLSSPSSSSPSSSSFPEVCAAAACVPSPVTWELLSVLQHADWPSFVLLSPAASSFVSSSSSSSSLLGLASDCVLFCWDGSSVLDGPACSGSSSSSPVWKWDDQT